MLFPLATTHRSLFLPAGSGWGIVRRLAVVFAGPSPLLLLHHQQELVWERPRASTLQVHIPAVRSALRPPRAAHGGGTVLATFDAAAAATAARVREVSSSLRVVQRQSFSHFRPGETATS